MKKDFIAACHEAKGIRLLLAKKLGLHRNSLQHYFKRWPEALDAFNEGRNEVLDVAESKLVLAINRGEPWAIKFFLSRLGQDRGYKLQKGPDELPQDQPLQVLEVVPISVTEWNRLNDPNNKKA